MNAQVQRALQQRIEAFASDITEILKDAVASSVAEALGPGGARGRTPKQGAQRGKRVDKAGRRTRERVQEEADTLFKEVQRKGGRRMEEIAKSLRKSTKALVIPMSKLVDAKKVKKKGVARGTTYRVA